MSDEKDPMHSYAAVFPKFNDLTDHQRKALNATSPFYITGPAGCGKSVVVLWKLISNLERNNKTILFAYNKMLIKYLQICVKQAVKEKNIDIQNAQDSIKSVYKEFVDLVPELDLYDPEKLAEYENCYEPYLCANNNFYWNHNKFRKRNYDTTAVIIDEAQDLEFLPLDMLAYYVPEISISADFNQQLYKDRVRSKEEIDNILSKYNRRTQAFQLNRIYRYPIAIYRFVTSFINRGENAEALKWLEQEAKRKNINQILPKVYDGIPKYKEMERLTSIIKSYKETNIAILLPYAGDNQNESNSHKYSSSVMYYYNYLSQIFTCSYYTSDKEQYEFELRKIHISTFKSSKGLEFDTVIIPQIELIENAFTKQLNEYYVALTRAKTNLILLSNKKVENISKFNSIDSRLYDKISYTEQKSVYEIDF